MDTSGSFGYWLRRQRKALDLTQQVLAERVGCSLAAIKKIESDERRPSRQIAERLADILAIPAAEREIFLEAARGLRRVNQFTLAHEPLVASLPTGTITVLYTDMEGSTQLWAQHPEAMAMAHAHHDEILREAIESNHGYVFQVAGDSFCAAFNTAGDAVRAAVKAQLDLHAEDWGKAPIRVRMGLHTGKAEAQRDGSYRGYVTLSYVQRLMAAGHGEQVLMSFATQQLVQDDLQEGIELRNLGEHRLKSFDVAERIFQLVLPGLPDKFPPLNSLSIFPNNLPVQLTSFIGRERELEELKRLLPGTRLLTLTGPGGTGKTRLALRLAADVLESFEQGVWLVELAPLADPALVPQMIAATLGVREQPGRTIMEALTDYLRAKTMLIVLDNCEHLIGACAHLANTLLRSVPSLKILATSRESFGIPGETTYQVPSLESPQPAQVSEIRAEELAEYAAVRLFAERAKDFLATFRLTNTNASAVAHICYRLDGMPLAIELAAARVRVLRVEEIAERLNDRFRLLTDGGRTVLPRHQTLRSLIDWSHGLLTEHEQILVRRLSVFAGGWTLQAAERVCTGAGLESDEILDLLTHLVNKSLVSLDEAGIVSRYRMLETIREYAREKLSGSGEAEVVRDRHLTFMLAFVKEAEAQFHGFDESAWFDRLEQDVGNLRTALEWGLSVENPRLVLGLSGSLSWFWWVRGYVLEAITWLTKALERPGADKLTGERAKALTALGWLQGALGEYDSSHTLFEESVSISRELGDKLALAETLSTWCQWIALYGYAAARPILEEALAVSRELGYRLGLARSLIGSGELQVYQGEDAAAQLSYEQCATLLRELGDRNFLSYVVRRLGHVALRKSDYQSATALCAESLRLNLQQKDPHGIAACFTAFGSIAARQDNAVRAAQLYGAAAVVLESFGGKLVPIDDFENQPHRLAARAALGEGEYQQNDFEGRAMSLEQAIALALQDDSEDSRLPKA